MLQYLTSHANFIYVTNMFDFDQKKEQKYKTNFQLIIHLTKKI